MTISKLAAQFLSPGGSRGRLAVFSFHQVLEEIDPLRVGEPDSRMFESDVELISSNFAVLPLGDAVMRLRAGTLPQGAACITFDDGYANNYEIAAPVLERMGTPATIFIATDAVERGVMWNDLMIEAFRNGSQRADFWNDVCNATGHSNNMDARWSVGELLASCKYFALAQRLEFSRQLYEKYVGTESPRFMMTKEMVRSLADRGFDMGGHTVNHPILKDLSPDDAVSEIVGCSQWLEMVTGTKPTSFAYPNGIPERDFDRSHEDMLLKAEFELAVSTEWSIATRKDREFRIPRIGPWWRQEKTFSEGLLRAYGRSYFR